MSEAITQCPACQTSFRVSASQLVIADGSVRCGACLNIFQAARHFLSPPLDLQERLVIEQAYWEAFEQYLLQVGQSLAQDLPGPPEERVDEDSGELDNHSINPDEQAATGVVVEDDQDLCEALIEYIWRNPSPVLPLDRAKGPIASAPESGDQFTGRESALTEQQTPSPHDSLDNAADETSPEAIAPSDYAPVGNTLSDPLGPGPSPIGPAPVDPSPGPWAEYGNAPAYDQVSLIEAPGESRTDAWDIGEVADQPGAGVTGVPRDIEQVETRVSAVDSDRSAELHPEEDWEEYLNLPDESGPGDDSENDNDNFADRLAGDEHPDVIASLDALELPSVEMPEVMLEQERPRPSSISLKWLPGIALLLLALGVQYAFFNIEKYAQFPTYRPWYQTACQTLGCTLPEYSNANELMTRDLVVRAHPDKNGALLLDVLLLNTGPYRQHFPALKLNFSDINGRTVASRIFNVEEYLGGELRGLKFIPAVTEVRIALALADPGKNALGYEMTVVAP